MKRAATLIAASLLCLSIVPFVHGQTGSDPLRTRLAEAVTSSSLENEGTPAFRIEASFATFDYLGEPVGSGTLTVEFLKPGFQKLTVHDGGSADRYAPEDQEAIGVDAPPTSGNFMQRLLVYLSCTPVPPVRIWS